VDHGHVTKDDAVQETVPESRWTRHGHGPSTPLVSVHSWSSEPGHDAALSAELGDLPVYSLLRPSGDGELPLSVDAWVDHARSVLAETGLEGPYHLFGWSYGGMLPD